MRILARGQILEDIGLYHTVHYMLNKFSAECNSYNDYTEGVSNIWEGCADNSTQALAGGNNANVVTDTYVKKGYQDNRTRPF